MADKRPKDIINFQHGCWKATKLATTMSLLFFEFYKKEVFNIQGAYVALFNHVTYYGPAPRTWQYTIKRSRPFYHTRTVNCTQLTQYLYIYSSGISQNTCSCIDLDSLKLLYPATCKYQCNGINCQPYIETINE